jgi:hypothetical protein
MKNHPIVYDMQGISGEAIDDADQGGKKKSPRK